MKAYRPDGSRVNLPPYWEGVCPRCQCTIHASIPEVAEIGNYIECPVCTEATVVLKRGEYVRLGQ